MKAGRIYGIIVAGILLLVIYALGLHNLNEAPYKIRVVYDEVDYEGELYSQLFYSTYSKNNPWREKMSFMGFIDGNEACFVIPMRLFDDIYTFRFDPAQKKTELLFEKMVFYKGFIPVKTVLPEEFLARISKMNFLEVQAEEGGLRLLPTKDDSQMYFDNAFGLDWEDKVKQGWIITMALITLLLSPILYVIHKWSGAVIEKIIHSIKSKIKAVKWNRFLGPAIHGCEKLGRFFLGRLKGIQAYLEQNPRRCIFMAAAFAALLIIILFWGYLTGEKYWIFTGIASDSYGQIFPNYYNAARRIEEGYNVAGWNFIAGLGNSIGKFLPSVNNWILFFGTENIRYLFFVSYVLKLVLSGVVFYFYLRVMGRNKITGLVFSLGYAFSGHMVIRGRWENMPREVFLVAVLLLCFELYFMKKDMRWLPLAIILFALNSSTYAVLLYGLVFCGYAVFRYFTERRFECRSFIRFAMGLAFCVLLAMPILIWNLEGVFDSVGSSRFESGVSTYTSLVGEERDWLISLENIQSAFFRTIGIGIVGMENVDFSGVINGLEDPTFYCGITTLLMLPAAISNKEKKKKYWYLGGLSIAALYFFIPPIHFLVGGMSGDSTFKISSFWIIVLLSYIGAVGFDNFLKDRALIKRVLPSAAALVAMSLLFVLFINREVQWRYLAYSLVFIAVYAILFSCFSKKAGQKYPLVLLMFLGGTCCLEVAVLTYSHINPDTALKNDNSRIMLEDYSIEALDYIKEENESNAYRIDKQYESYGRNDALYQDYMSTKTYVGGLGTRSELVELYQELYLPKMGGSTLMGTTVSDEVNTLSGVKYILSNTGMVPNYGYIYKETVENISIYENQYALPLAYGYQAYMYRSDFEKLSVQEKRDALLKYCVLEDGEGEKNLIPYEGDIIDRTKMLKEYAVSWLQKEGNLHFLRNTEGNVMAVRIRTESQASDKDRNNVYFVDHNDVSGNVDLGIPIGESEQLLVFNQKDVDRLYFELDEDVAVEVLSVSRIPQEVYYEYYRQCISELKGIKAENIVIDEAGSFMRGRISVASPTELCFSIPYDEGWQLYLNGEKTELEKLNIGFMGAYCEEGEYEFELQYLSGESPLKSYFTIFSIAACVLNAVAWGIVYHKKHGKG